jgi:acyl carrier protein
MQSDSSSLPVASALPGPQTENERALAELIVASLNLETAAAEIEPDAPLYGDGLGLDSIDILEMSLAISKAYGVQLRSDDPDNGKIFRSLRTLSAYIQARRTK